MVNHKFSTYVLIGCMLLIGVVYLISAFASEDLDQICDTNNSTLFRLGGVWICGNLTYAFNGTNGINGTNAPQIWLNTSTYLYINESYPQNINVSGSGTFDYVNIMNGTAGYLINSTKVMTIKTSSLGTGNENLFFQNSGNAVLTGSRNLFVGDSIGKFVTSATDNIGLGRFALQYLRTGIDNIGIGYGALGGNISGMGSYNIAIGDLAGFLTTGSNNVFIGNNAGYSETGSNKLYIANNQTNNLIIGDFDSKWVKINGNLNITGNQVNTGNVTANKFIGDGSRLTNVNVSGSYAQYQFTNNNFNGSGNISGSAYQINNVNALSFPETNSVAIGNNALGKKTTGNNNFCAGTNACVNITTGTYNIAIGANALYQAIGGSGLGNYNTAIGGNALYETVGNYNLGIGYGSMGSIGYTGTQSMTANTGIGAYTMGHLQSGAYNTALGYSSGFGLSSGANNVFIGYSSGYFQTTGSNLLLIDSYYRGNSTNETSQSIIVGQMNINLLFQNLTFNANTKVNGNLNVTNQAVINSTIISNDITTRNINATGNINTQANFSVNNIQGITGGYTILKDVDLIGLTKTYCNLNFTGGILYSTTC